MRQKKSELELPEQKYKISRFVVGKPTKKVSGFAISGLRKN
jgi:hypothetical protein